jgi:FMN phosphatase YigB (HAD superfamily)
MAIRVVAFDVYGTLGQWATGGVEPIEVQRLLTRYGIEISYEAYETARRAVMFFDTPKRAIVGWTDYLAHLFARLNVAISTDLLASISTMYETRHRFDLYSDALPAIEAARSAGKITCAFTTLPRFMVDGTGQGISARLHHYFDASAIGQPKSHPAFYRGIVERLGVAPSEILAVGDDPICDVELPIEAGWRAVLLDRDGKNTSIGSRQTDGIKSLAELSKHYSE